MRHAVDADQIQVGPRTARVEQAALDVARFPAIVNELVEACARGAIGEAGRRRLLATLEDGVSRMRGRRPAG